MPFVDGFGVTMLNSRKSLLSVHVEKVLDILRAELAMVMGQMGTPALRDIGLNSIGRH